MTKPSGIIQQQNVSITNKLLLRKRVIIESVYVFLNNTCRTEHSRCRSVTGLIVNVISGFFLIRFYHPCRCYTLSGIILLVSQLDFCRTRVHIYCYLNSISRWQNLPPLFYSQIELKYHILLTHRRLNTRDGTEHQGRI